MATCRPGEYPPHLGSPSAAPSRGQHLAPGGILCTYNDNVFHQYPPSQSGVVLELDLKAEKFKIAKNFRGETKPPGFIFGTSLLLVSMFDKCKVLKNG